MSEELNRSLSRRWFEEVWNKRRAQAIDEMFALDGIAHGLDPAGTLPKPGPEPFRAFWQQFCRAFPDLYITVEDVIAEGDQTAIRISFRGTHRGELAGAPASHQPVAGTGICVTRWRNGQIIEAWNEFDALGVFLQTGAAQLAGGKK